MQFEYTSPQTEMEAFFGGFFCINAFGSIGPNDPDEFIKFLKRTQPPPRTTVYINSTGGNVEAAMALGRTIRDCWFETSIGTYQLGPANPANPIVHRELIPGKCLSAATLMYLGGRLRHFNSNAEFGVHQFSFKNPLPQHISQSQVLSAKIAQYVSDMGISPDFLNLSSSVPGHTIHLVDHSKLTSLNVVTGGQTEASWSVQAKNGLIYVRGERDSMWGHHKVMLAYNKGEGFIFWSVIEAMGREDELTTFPLVELVLNGEDTRIDISARCIRAVNGIYVNIFAKITDEEAEAISLSESFGVQIRASAQAELFLGVAAMSTEGGKDELATLYETLNGKPSIRPKLFDDDKS